MSEDHSANPAPAEALNEVVDDASAREAAITFAADAIRTGQSFEAVADTLAQSGWHQAEAEDIVEEARKLTRSDRGVTTLNEVLRENHRHHRSTMFMGWTVGFPALNAAVSLRRSLTYLFSRKKK